MARLYYNDEEQRAAWLMYAITFGERGLWPDGEIETHGPHGYDADLIWGKATVSRFPDRRFVEVTFETAHGVTGIGDLTGFSVQDDEGNAYPKLPRRGLTVELVERLKVARAERS